MKYFYLILAMGIILSGCKSGEQSRKGESKKESKKETARIEMQKEKEEKEKLEQEKLAREQEEKRAKEELERKKMESEKQKEELRKVQENLKRMGLAALRIDAVKDGNLIKYSDGKTVNIKGPVSDREILMTLDDLLKKAQDDERKKTNAEPVCRGGYETCQNGFLYVHMMWPSKDGVCAGEWYKTEQECK